MRHLRLTEHDPAIPVGLSADEAEALALSELAVVSRVPGSSTWSVSAGTKVGVLAVGRDLQVTVAPKVGIARLVFLMGYARRPRFWRENSVLLKADADLVDALAESFRRLAAQALRRGVLQGYLTVGDALPVLRGRVRVGEQVARRFGRGLPLEVTFDEFTTDIAENRLLLGAALRLLRLPGLRPGTRRALQRLRLQLVEVTPAQGRVRPEWHPSRLNERYQAALHLAELILDGDSFDQRVGGVEVSGFVLDMPSIYEDFVCVALKESLRRHGGSTVLQPPMHLDDARAVQLRPDLVWTGARQVVVDAKYKAEKPSGFPQADLYQLLAYCTVLGTTHGHLVYAGGNEEPALHAVRRSGVVLTCHTLDLARPPGTLIAQVDVLADVLAGPEI